MRVSRDCKKKIQNVLYVPGLKTNLLSVSKIIDENYIVVFDKKQCLIKDCNNNIIARGLWCNDMYRFDGIPKQQQAFFTCSTSKNQLWHERYGHLNYFYMKFLHKHNLVNGLPNIEEDKSVREACLARKQYHFKFDNNKTIATEVLEFIHSDVCGPMKTQSLGGAMYFVTFINDFSRKIWVYFLKNKSDVFAVFKQFKVTVENESGERIKVFRNNK